MRGTAAVVRIGDPDAVHTKSFDAPFVEYYRPLPMICLTAAFVHLFTQKINITDISTAHECSPNNAAYHVHHWLALGLRWKTCRIRLPTPLMRVQILLR